jgi:hypothetical protein
MQLADALIGATCAYLWNDILATPTDIPQKVLKRYVQRLI